MSQAEYKQGAVRWIVRTLVFAIIMGVALFWTAKNLWWGAGWGYIGLFVLSRLITLGVLYRRSPDLLVERADTQEGTKGWDRLLSGLVALYGPLSIWIVAGLDQRNGWTENVGVTPRIIGLAVVLLGIYLSNWALVANRFFSGTVRIQAERGHAVVSDGPYRLVRHPGYLGAALYDLGTPLFLASWWTFIPAGITVLFLLLRTALEDKTLQAELPGYDTYAHKTRYRLIPGIW
jgi:protein-S-isoprenylcysteine O-methyltransferase Ste14